jgi:hypothetical protein
MAQLSAENKRMQEAILEIGKSVEFMHRFDDSGNETYTNFAKVEMRRIESTIRRADLQE